MVCIDNQYDNRVCYKFIVLSTSVNLEQSNIEFETARQKNRYTVDSCPYFDQSKTSGMSWNSLEPALQTFYIALFKHAYDHNARNKCDSEVLTRVPGIPMYTCGVRGGSGGEPRSFLRGKTGL